jgi:hypothetical protein
MSGSMSQTNMPSVFGTFVLVQAIRIDDEDEPGELNYTNYLKDVESFIPEERRSRLYNSSS